MAWLRQLLDWQRETEDPGEFLDALRFDLGPTEVFVFTPKGDVIALPLGATPVDFAYAVHTEVGHRCVGARVNGKLVPLESTLDNGDVVEVFTSKATSAGPSRDWLTFVKSAAGPQQDQGVVLQGAPRGGDRAGQGRARPGDAQAGPAAAAPDRPAARCSRSPRDLRYADITALYAAIGEGHVSAAVRRAAAGAVARRGGRRDRGPRRGHRADARGQAPAAAQGRPGRRGQGRRATSGSSWPAAARRCPVTTIVGFVTRGRRRLRAPRRLRQRRLAAATQADRIVEVEWAPTSSSVFLVQIQVEALDRARLLSDVTRTLSDQHVNILSASVTTTPGPDRAVPLHLRDGRPQAPRRRCSTPSAASRASTTSTG